MSFLKNSKLEKANGGTYVFTVVCVLLALVVGQLITQFLANNYLGFSLLSIPFWVNKNTALILLLAPFGLGLLTLFLCVKFIHKRSFLSVLTSRSKFDWSRFFFAFFIWMVVMLGFMVISYFTTKKILFQFHFSELIFLFLISIFLLPIQIFAEEVLFRGLLFQGLGRVFKRGIVPVVLTSILFGLMHAGNPEVIKLGGWIVLFYVSSGLFLQIVTHMDDGLELSAGYHAANNFFAAFVLTNNWQAFTTDALFVDNNVPDFGIENSITLIIIQPLLVFLFSKRYNWGNWKNKFFSVSNENELR